MRGIAWLVLLTASLACGCRGTVVDHVPLDIALPGAPDCRAPIGPITLTALGDFPTTDRDVALLDGTGGVIDPVTRFLPWTLAFSASARASGWEAFGWATRDSLETSPALVMRPLGLSCPLADPEARLPAGAAVAVLDEGRVMFVGGLDESGQATRRVAILHAREESVELPAVPRVIPIAFASATLVPEADSVLVAGGASMRDGEGRDTWERIPVDGGMATFGSLEQSRRDHAAIAIDVPGVHGVLLIGGSSGSSALDSIEWVDPTSDTGASMRSRLGTARLRPLIVPLDATHLGIAAGVDLRGAAVPAIDVLDVAHDTLTTLALSLDVPDWVVALPSGRLAWAASGMLSIVSIREGRVDAFGPVPAVLDPVATASLGGRILLEGHRADGTRLGYVIDPGLGTVTAAATSRVPSATCTLADGTTLELAAAGASLRRDERVTPFDSPPPTYLFASDRAQLALDVAGHWAVSGGVLGPAAGVESARLDVPGLRFAHFEATFDATGAYDVVVTGEHLEALATIGVTDDAITLGACTVTRSPSDGRVRVLRGVGNALLVVTEHGTRGCDAVDPTLRVGIGIVAHAGASLRSLALQRDLLVR